MYFNRFRDEFQQRGSLKDLKDYADEKGYVFDTHWYLPGFTKDPCGEKCLDSLIQKKTKKNKKKSKSLQTDYKYWNPKALSEQHSVFEVLIPAQKKRKLSEDFSKDKSRSEISTKLCINCINKGNDNRVNQKFNNTGAITNNIHISN